MLELGINILSTNRLKDIISTFYKDKAYLYTNNIYKNLDIYRPNNLPIINNNRTIILTTIKYNSLYKAKLDILYPKGLERN